MTQDKPLIKVEVSLFYGKARLMRGKWPFS